MRAWEISPRLVWKQTYELSFSFPRAKTARASPFSKHVWGSTQFNILMAMASRVISLQISVSSAVTTLGILNFCAIVSAGNWPRSNNQPWGMRLELTLNTWPVSCRLRRTPSRAFDSPGKRSSVCTSLCHPRRARLPVPVSTSRKRRTVITLKTFKLYEEIYRIISCLTCWRNMTEFKLFKKFHLQRMNVTNDRPY